MYVKITEDLYNQISDATLVDYEMENGLVSVDNIMSMLADLVLEIHNREEQLEDLQKEISENYELKKVDLYNEYGISEKDFI